MLTCAIAECGAKEHFLRSGTLHLTDVKREVGSGPPLKKMIWLCPVCSVSFVVQTWREPGQQIRPRQRAFPYSPDQITSRPPAVMLPSSAKRTDPHSTSAHRPVHPKRGNGNTRVA
jgi:hypothetical protein